MSKETVLIEGITLTLYRKNIKNMYLRILPPDGEVKISAPLYLSDEEITNFVKSKKEWILKKQDLILKNGIKAPLKYVNSEKHFLWGNEYTLQLISNENIKQVLVDKEKSILYLPVPKRSTIEKRRKILAEFYRLELKKAIPPVLEKCVKIVGKKPSEVKIRNMKNWGKLQISG